MGDMRFQAKITFDQYKDTCLAVAAAKPGKGNHKKSWKGYVSLALVCLALGLSPQLPGARVPAFVIFSIIVLLGILSKPLARRSQDRCFRSIFSEEEQFLNGQLLTVDESGITCDRIDGQATSHNSWQSLTKRIDTPDAYIFLPSPNSFIRVPKEFLSKSDLELIWKWSSMVPAAENN